MTYFAGNNFHPGNIFPKQRGVRFKRVFLRTLIVACVSVALTLPALPAAADTPKDLLGEGHVDQAMQVLEQHIHNDPTAEAYNLLCRADFELDAWDSGIPACERAVALAPSNGLHHLWLGRIYGEKADRAGFLKAAGLAKKVRVEFERAVEFAPDSWEAHTDLAEFYLEAPGIVGGGEDKARAQADLLLPLNPGMAHWVRARIAQKKKDERLRKGVSRRHRRQSRRSSRVVNLAGFYRHTDHLDEMVQALRTMESRPLDRPAAFMDGASLLLRNARDDPLATRLVRRYLAFGPVEEWPAFKAHYLLGELLEKQGERDAAAEQYRAALAMAHTFAPAQEGLQRVAR